MLLFLIGCTARAPLGAMDEEVIPDLWAGVGPDNLTWLYFTARTVWAPNDAGEWCPEKQEGGDDSSYVVIGGCTDDWGNTWQGEMSVFTELSYADLQDFGVLYDPVTEVGVTHDWRYDGEVSWLVDANDGHVEVHLDGDLDLHSSGGEHPTDIVGGLSADTSLTRQVDRMTIGTGEFTLEGWGRVEFTIDQAQLDGISGCQNGADGVIEIVGENQAAIWLPEVSRCLEDEWACPDLELGGVRQEWCRTENELGWNDDL